MKKIYKTVNILEHLIKMLGGEKVTEALKGKNTLDYLGIDGVAAKDIQKGNCITRDEHHLIHSFKEVFKKQRALT